MKERHERGREGGREGGRREGGKGGREGRKEGREGREGMGRKRGEDRVDNFFLYLIFHF
jgi:hypothetical protein